MRLLNIIASLFFTLSLFSTNITSFLPHDLATVKSVETLSCADFHNIPYSSQINNFRYTLQDYKVVEVLCMKTSLEAFNHNQFVCGRAKGASIKDLMNFTIDGQEYIVSKVRNENASTEYVISFAVWSSGSKYKIENHWDAREYPLYKNYFNFQIRSKDQKSLRQIVVSIIDKFNARKSTVLNSSVLPSLYLSNVHYLSNIAQLKIWNKSQGNKVLTLKYKPTETSDWKWEEKLLALKSGFNTVNIPVEEAYELEFLLSEKDFVVQERYFVRDGVWHVFDHFGANEVDFLDVEYVHTEFEEEEFYHVSRDILIEAIVKNDLVLNRSLKSDIKPLIEKRFSVIRFNAAGEGNVIVELVKNAHSDQEKVFEHETILTSSNHEYAIGINAFTHNDIVLNSLEDIDEIRFRFTVNSFQRFLDVNIGAIRFTDIRESSQPVINTEKPIEIAVYPNPTTDYITVNAKQERDQLQSVSIINIQNQSVYSESFESYNTKSIAPQKSIDVSQLDAGQYIVMIQLESGKILKEKLVKI